MIDSLLPVSQQQTGFTCPAKFLIYRSRLSYRGQVDNFNPFLGRVSHRHRAKLDKKLKVR